MKAYRVKKKDAGCCGGHDKYPAPCLRYNSQKKRSEARKRKDRPRKKSARQKAKVSKVDSE